MDFEYQLMCCAICLELIEEVDQYETIECKHRFHQNCILKWIKHSYECPLCRRFIGSKAITSSMNNNPIASSMHSKLKIISTMSWIDQLEAFNHK